MKSKDSRNWITATRDVSQELNQAHSYWSNHLVEFLRTEQVPSVLYGNRHTYYTYYIIRVCVLIRFVNVSGNDDGPGVPKSNTL